MNVINKQNPSSTWLNYTGGVVEAGIARDDNKKEDNANVSGRPYGTQTVQVLEFERFNDISSRLKEAFNVVGNENEGTEFKGEVDAKIPIWTALRQYEYKNTSAYPQKVEIYRYQYKSDIYSGNDKARPFTLWWIGRNQRNFTNGTKATDPFDIGQKPTWSDNFNSLISCAKVTEHVVPSGGMFVHYDNFQKRNIDLSKYVTDTGIVAQKAHVTHGLIIIAHACQYRNDIPEGSPSTDQVKNQLFNEKVLYTWGLAEKIKIEKPYGNDSGSRRDCVFVKNKRQTFDEPSPVGFTNHHDIAWPCIRSTLGNATPGGGRNPQVTSL